IAPASRTATSSTIGCACRRQCELHAKRWRGLSICRPDGTHPRKRHDRAIEESINVTIRGRRSEVSRIKNMKEAQIDRLPEFIDRWTRISLSTGPADRPRAEAAIRNMYRQGGFDPPQAIVWCESPFSLILTPTILLEKELLKQIW